MSLGFLTTSLHRVLQKKIFREVRRLEFANQQTSLIIVQAKKARQPRVSLREKLTLSYQLRNIFCISSILYSLVSFLQIFLEANAEPASSESSKDRVQKKEVLKRVAQSLKQRVDIMNLLEKLSSLDASG